jgi:putative transposase
VRCEPVYLETGNVVRAYASEAAIAERLVGTRRPDCLGHVVVVNERHLRTVLAEFARFYNRERPQRALRLETPVPVVRSTTGSIRASPVLGGLHHVYERVA